MIPPYAAQWESEALVPEFLAGRDAATDPLWGESGAADAAEYARWARHLCGMACLRMAMAARGEVLPIQTLRREVQALGGYVEMGEDIRGLIYAGAVRWLNRRGVPAGTRLEQPVEELSALLADGALFIASVHPLIRMPEAPPPCTGGHLVLVFGVDGAARLRFHNPSGHTPETRRDVRMDLAAFSRFHADRGILLG